MSSARWLQRGLRFARAVVLAALLLGALTTISAAAGEPGKTGFPNSMASLGDSITRAFNTGFFPFTDATGNSWSTGGNNAVNSHYRRILTHHSLISGKNYNDAKSGAKMSDLNGQVATAVAQNVEYVTILLGANDVCASNEASMTPVATFRTQFQTALNRLTSGLPNARIFVGSIPDAYRLWVIFKDNSSARFAWSLFGICPSMLANPTSQAQADVERRARVRQRVIDFNTQLAQVCAQYIHCRFDNSINFTTPFVTSDVSARDYFHPSLAGEAKLASVSYSATFNFADASAPLTTATATPAAGGVKVRLSASDNAGVSGIEVKLGVSAWTRYTSPVFVATGVTLTYRAVDVNGNIEAAKTMTP